MKFTVLLLIFSAGCFKNNQGLELHFQDEFISSGQTVKKTISLLDNKARVDVQIPGMNTSVYFKQGHPAFYVAVHSMKSLIQNQIGNKAGISPLTLDPSLKNLGMGQVKGIPCQLKEKRQGQDLILRLCQASFSDLKVTKKEKEILKLLMKALSESLGEKYGAHEGLIIQSEVFSDKGKLISRSLLNELKRKEVSPKLFDSPVGYKRYDRPPPGLSL